MKQLAAVLLLLPAAALARKPQRARAGPQVDPARFFATHKGLIRIYEGRGGKTGDDEPPAGASCEVLESKPGLMKETCSMIVGRKPKPATELTYELRKDGIWNTEVRLEGKPQPVERLRVVHLGGPRQVPHGQERGRLVQGGGPQLRRLPGARRGAEAGQERGAPLYRNVRRRRRPGRRRPVGSGRRQRTLESVPERSPASCHSLAGPAGSLFDLPRGSALVSRRGVDTLA